MRFMSTGVIMRKLSLTSCLLLAGCGLGPTDLANSISASTNVLGLFNATNQLEQVLDEDLIKQSTQLEYLSNGEATCTDNPGFRVKDYGNVRNVAKQAREEMNKYFVELAIIEEYSTALETISKARTQYVADTNNLRTISREIGQFTPETKAIAAVADLILAASVAVNAQETARLLIAAAKKYDVPLRKSVASIKVKLPVLNRQTLERINVWRRCVDEKFLYMKQPKVLMVLPTSAVDLDNAYGAFQLQYKTYLGSVPDIAKALDAVVKANTEIANAETLDDISAAATQMAASIKAVVAAYEAARALPKQLSM